MITQPQRIPGSIARRWAPYSAVLWMNGSLHALNRKSRGLRQDRNRGHIQPGAESRRRIPRTMDGYIWKVGLQTVSSNPLPTALKGAAQEPDDHKVRCQQNNLDDSHAESQFVDFKRDVESPGYHTQPFGPRAL